MRSFPTAGGPGERKCECTGFENQTGRVTGTGIISSCKNQPLDALTGDEKGVDRLQGLWKVGEKDVYSGNVDKINPGCYTAHVVFANIADYRGAYKKHDLAY